LHCEVFDAVQNVSAAAGLRLFIKSPLKLITLRDAIVFVLIAVIIVPFGTAFWGAAFTISNHYGTHYWVEWRNLGISNAVTTIILVPAILLGVHHWSAQRTKATPARRLEAVLLGVSILTVGLFAFDHLPAGPDASPALLYAPIPLLIWAALRFGLGGMSASMLVITIQAIWGTMHGRGPFLMQTPAENALALQMFLLFTATPLMFLTIIMAEERRTQDALRESEARFRTMADAAPVMIWMAGPDKLCDYFNQRWLDFTCRPHEAEVGDGWITNVYPEDVGPSVAGYREAFDSRKPFTVEYRLRRRDGQYRWILAHAVPRLTAGGEFLGYIGSCIDITDRRRVEEANRNLAHVQRLAVMGELTAMIAHEVNQPLGAILSNADAAELLLESSNPPLDEIQKLWDIRKNDLQARIDPPNRALLRKREMQMDAGSQRDGL
jgi:PAS domain S-box-containing protein